MWSLRILTAILLLVPSANPSTSGGSVTFTAVVQDNWGVQTTTQAVVTVTGSSSTTPYTNGLRLMLAADLGVTTNSSGAVTSWAAATPVGANRPIGGCARRKAWSRPDQYCGGQNCGMC